jgi:hypothetical protein
VFGGSADINLALRRLGELLDAAGQPFAIVIIGGAALNLMGVVSRATRDVDILAFARPPRGGKSSKLVPPPTPLPESLVAAIRTVARDLGLADDWLNTQPALQWSQGLPRGLLGRVQWRQYAALRVGVVGRADAIRLKLFAAADDAPQGRHARDLAALNPTDADLRLAARWAKTQDASPHFSGIVDQVVSHVRAHR